METAAKEQIRVWDSRGVSGDSQAECAPAVSPLNVATRTATLAEVFAAEESGLLRFALSLVRKRSAAEDLVQEAFLRLHQNWSEVENPRAWLFRSVRNLALNYLRDHPQESELVEEGSADSAAPIPQQMVKDEAIGMIRLLLAEMSAEDRRLIELKYQHDCKYQEISRRTGMSVSNVGFRLHYLLKRLADGLKRAGIEGSVG